MFISNTDTSLQSKGKAGTVKSLTVGNDLNRYAE